ncbi:MAG: phosphoribosyl-AMP cyclohydrolase [Candidatus Omnitrophota bacterium]|nr:MAG: phosphoribosyl-AMP cyclohydrolase [Candidatus Omnitrophota bacterium]
MRDKEILDFEKHRLIPVIVQDIESNEVLMLGYMNREALEKTLSTGKMHFFSRSRQRIWLKGEESGHCQFLKELYVDCDRDSLLAKVEQIKAACHKGYRSCFYQRLEGKNWKVVGKKIFEPEQVYKKEKEERWGESRE